MAHKKSIVLVGCGHANALALLALGDRPQNIRLTVIEGVQNAVYSGMLPGWVAGHYSAEMLQIDVAHLCKAVGARFLQQWATSIDNKERAIRTDSGEHIAFDAAAFDVGITSRMPSLPGFSERAVAVKPLAQYLQHWESYIENTDTARVAVIGGGAAGVELALAMAYRFRILGKKGAFHLIDRGLVVSSFRPRLRTKILHELKAHDIEIHAGRDATRVSSQGVHLGDGTLIDADFVVGASGATPHAWLENTDLALSHGFINVGADLQTNVSGVFAAGDCTHFLPSPLPKAGVYAVRQGPVLAKNLLATVQGQPTTPYHPQQDYLKLISLGGRQASAEKYGFVVSGKWAWYLKDRIDRSFMARFRV